MTSEGDANKPNLIKNREGENKVTADAIARKSLTNLASMTVSKGVSSAYVQSGITKPSFPLTNEGDQMKMPKLFHLSQSVFVAQKGYGSLRMQRKRRNLAPKREIPSPLKYYLLSTKFYQQFLLNTHQELWTPILVPQPIIN